MLRVVPRGEAVFNGRIKETISDAADSLNRLANTRRWKLYCDASLLFEHPLLKVAADIWRAKSAPDRCPARAEFSAREMKPFLRDLTILDIVREDGRTRYHHRYAGTEIEIHFGPITGRYLDEFLPPELMSRTLACFELVAKQRQPLRILTQFSLPGVEHLGAEAFLFPLSQDGITADKLMSVTYFKGVRTFGENFPRALTMY